MIEFGPGTVTTSVGQSTRAPNFNLCLEDADPLVGQPKLGESNKSIAKRDVKFTEIGCQTGSGEHS